MSNSIFWLIGYSTMWAGKWLLGSIITQSNIIQDATGEAKMWLPSQTNAITNIIDEIKNKLLVEMNHITWILCLVILLMYFAIYIAKKRVNIKKEYIISFLLIAIYPIVWFFVVKNHVLGHGYMTYRNFGVTLYSLGMMLICSLEYDKI